MSNVLSVAGGAQAKAESSHGRERLFPHVRGKREKSEKPQPKKKEPSKNETGVFMETLFQVALRGKDDLFVKAIGSVSCYLKAQRNTTHDWKDFGSKT